MEITVETSGKHLTVSDLCFMAFARFKLDFAFQVNIAAGKQAEFNVLINRAYGKAKFGMFHNDLIRGLPLPDKWSNNRINVVKLFFRKVDTGS